MARRRNSSVYSIYHNMEDRGIFEQNTANAQAVSTDGLSTYKGPVEYPKMLFHPQGQTRVVFQGLMVVDPKSGDAVLDKEGNPRYTGTQVVVEHRVVNSLEEEQELLELGWHQTEAQARRLSTDPKIAAKAPPKTKTELMEEKIRELEGRLATADAGVVNASKLPGTSLKPAKDLPLV